MPVLGAAFAQIALDDAPFLIGPQTKRKAPLDPNEAKAKKWRADPLDSAFDEVIKLLKGFFAQGDLSNMTESFMMEYICGTYTTGRNKPNAKRRIATVRQYWEKVMKSPLLGPHDVPAAARLVAFGALHRDSLEGFIDGVYLQNQRDAYMEEEDPEKEVHEFYAFWKKALEKLLPLCGAVHQRVVVDGQGLLSGSSSPVAPRLKIDNLRVQRPFVYWYTLMFDNDAGRRHVLETQYKRLTQEKFLPRSSNYVRKQEEELKASLPETFHFDEDALPEVFNRVYFGVEVEGCFVHPIPAILRRAINACFSRVTDGSIHCDSRWPGELNIEPWEYITDVPFRLRDLRAEDSPLRRALMALSLCCIGSDDASAGFHVHTSLMPPDAEAQFDAEGTGTPYVPQVDRTLLLKMQKALRSGIERAFTRVFYGWQGRKYNTFSEPSDDRAPTVTLASADKYRMFNYTPWLQKTRGSNTETKPLAAFVSGLVVHHSAPFVGGIASLVERVQELDSELSELETELNNGDISYRDKHGNRISVEPPWDSGRKPEALKDHPLFDKDSIDRGRHWLQGRREVLIPYRDHVAELVDKIIERSDEMDGALAKLDNKENMAALRMLYAVVQNPNHMECRGHGEFFGPSATQHFDGRPLQHLDLYLTAIGYLWATAESWQVDTAEDVTVSVPPAARGGTLRPRTLKATQRIPGVVEVPDGRKFVKGYDGTLYRVDSATDKPNLERGSGKVGGK